MDTGSIAWAIIATALVLFMTPGVAFFYGGLVKAKSVVSMMMISLFNTGSRLIRRSTSIPSIFGIRISRSTI